MKKFKLLIALVAIAGAVGAKTYQKLDPLYRYDLENDVMVEINPEEGDCVSTTEPVYCKYVLKSGELPDGTPSHYQPAPGETQFQIWDVNAR